MFDLFDAMQKLTDRKYYLLSTSKIDFSWLNLFGVAPNVPSMAGTSAETTPNLEEQVSLRKIRKKHNSLTLVAANMRHDIELLS